VTVTSKNDQCLAVGSCEPAFRSRLVESLLETPPNGVAADSDRPRSLRVAIADDCTDGANIMAMLVRLWGYEAEVAYGGAEALHMIMAYDPGVVVLDIGMPMVTGWTVARQLRRLPRFEHTLIIAITGHADEVHRRTSLAAGFDYFFAKPCEPQDLKNALLLFHQVRPDGRWSDGSSLALADS
jgi:CheY-like chemotaxis protein